MISRRLYHLESLLVLGRVLKICRLPEINEIKASVARDGIVTIGVVADGYGEECVELELRDCDAYGTYDLGKEGRCFFFPGTEPTTRMRLAIEVPESGKAICTVILWMPDASA